MPLVMGIDPGTAITGFGVIQERSDGSLEALAYGVIRTPAGMPAHQRLELLHREISGLLAQHQPESCAVERLFFQRNVSTAIAVGQARGVLLLAIAQAGKAVFEYTPNEVKQAACGYGSASKRQVQEMVRVLLGLDEIPQPDDAADALAIAICHLNTHRYAPENGHETP